MEIIRIAANTQLSREVPIYVYGARLVHSADTTADIYDEDDSSKTAAKKKIPLRTSAEVLVDEVKFGKPVRFSEGVYVDWTAGEVFLYIDKG